MDISDSGVNNPVNAKYLAPAIIHFLLTKATTDEMDWSEALSDVGTLADDIQPVLFSLGE